jgi:hypothetical protein
LQLLLTLTGTAEVKEVPGATPMPTSEVHSSATAGAASANAVPTQAKDVTAARM